MIIKCDVASEDDLGSHQSLCEVDASGLGDGPIAKVMEGYNQSRGCRLDGPGGELISDLEERKEEQKPNHIYLSEENQSRQQNESRRSSEACPLSRNSAGPAGSENENDLRDIEAEHRDRASSQQHCSF